MSENCNHDCSNCKEKCSKPEDFKVKQNEYSNVKKVIGIVSGKGGVGKSLVSSLMAVAMNKKGFSTAILDADITGPSIPKMFGINEKITSPDGKYINPGVSNDGTKVVSINLLLENDSDPVVWRGPVIAGTVKQFWSDTIWGDVDYMFVDMPPGTGDVPLTVFQSLPLSGIIIVTSPQELVSMIVSKAVKMANLMGIPVIGIVENMSYFNCPDCGKKLKIFGESNIDKVANDYGINVISKLPINTDVANLCDNGNIEQVNSDFIINLENIIKEI